MGLVLMLIIALFVVFAITKDSARNKNVSLKKKTYNSIAHRTNAPLDWHESDEPFCKEHPLSHHNDAATAQYTSDYNAFDNAATTERPATTSPSADSSKPSEPSS